MLASLINLRYVYLTYKHLLQGKVKLTSLIKGLWIVPGYSRHQMFCHTVPNEETKDKILSMSTLHLSIYFEEVKWQCKFEGNSSVTEPSSTFLIKRLMVL